MLHSICESERMDDAVIYKQLLIVADNSEISQSIQARLESTAMKVDCTASLSTALENVIKNTYCLLIIDLQMLNMDNAEIVRIFRVAKHTPILALTGMLGVEEKVSLFHAGVDAFLEKPVNADICAAQANALIELYLKPNQELEKSAPVVFGTSLVIALRYRQVLVNGASLELTRREFDLLYFLSTHPGQVFSRNQIYDL